MSSHQPPQGGSRTAVRSSRFRRALGLGLLAPAALALALAGAAAAPSQASAADPPRVITTSRVNTIACVPGPANTVRARVGGWMRVVNDDGIGEWADHMEAKARLEPTSTGLSYTRRWTSYKTPRLTQNHRHTKGFVLLTDNVSGTAEWRVHVKLIWHRPAPIRNITKHFYYAFNGGCATTTGGGGGALPPPGGALPSGGGS